MSKQGRAWLAVAVGGLLLTLLLALYGPAPGPAYAGMPAVSVQPQHEAVYAVFAQTSTVATAVDLQGGRLVAIQMPSTWEAANLTFQGSWDGGAYNNVYDDGGNEVSVTAAASRYIVFDALGNIEGLRFVKVRSGSAGTVVTQTAATTVTLIVRP